MIRSLAFFLFLPTAITRIYLDITREEVGDLYDMDDLFVY
jgi:hypothetical protein